MGGCVRWQEYIEVMGEKWEEAGAQYKEGIRKEIEEDKVGILGWKYPLSHA